MCVIVAIPVYKNPNEDELIALHRCCQILSRYDMSLVCPQSFDVSMFQSIWLEYNLKLKIDRFEDKYFADIEGYNHLLLSREFYARYVNYDYMLIYQPDAYVFYDALAEWCQKGYDYIGAPLVGSYVQTEYLPTMPLHCGNGGFSLRRVKAFLNYFDGQHNVFSSQQIVRHIALKNKFYTRWFVWLLMMFGWRNRPRIVAAQYKWNEDGFWSGLLNDSQYPLTQPQAEEALLFAFERFPKEMYEKTCGQLPFGCHAWKKYEYEDFWRGKIE